MVISKKKKKKKRSSPKFGLLFLAVPHHHLSKFPDFAQIFHIAARKTMVLPKYFLLTARKILILPKSSKLGGAIAPPAPPAGTAMIGSEDLFFGLRPRFGNKFILFAPQKFFRWCAYDCPEFRLFRYGNPIVVPTNAV